jgi:CubicO group peptidase (beta-lactamase class C family)
MKLEKAFCSRSGQCGIADTLVNAGQPRRRFVRICMTAEFAIALVFVPVLASGQGAPIEPRLSDLAKDIAAHLDVPGLAVAVTKGNKIIYERGFGWADRERGLRATPKTTFAIASISKSITATAIMQLFERGKLNLDAPVNDYLGSAKVHSPHWNAAESTVGRVMSHTGGLTTFTRWCGSDRSACNLDREIRDYGLVVWRPGELFDYSNLGFGVLGDVIARVSGDDYDSYLKKNIFAPLGMEGCGLTTLGSASSQYDDKTHARSQARISGTPAASGLRCSAHDLALFGIFQLKPVKTSNSILSSANLDQMHRAQPGTRGQYGLGWWTSERSRIEIISAQGGTSDTYALLTLVPTKNVTVVVVANSYSQFVSNLGERILEMVVPERSALATGPSQTAASIPPSVIGEWSGQILVLGRPVRISLMITPSGAVRGRLADGPLTELKNVSIESSHVYGELAASRDILDAPHGDFTLAIDLALNDGQLMGAATSQLPAGQEGDQLPHWIQLARQAER